MVELSERQRTILLLLVRHKGLTTRQLHRALTPADPRDTTPTAHTLQLLEKRGFVRKTLVHPERGAASERLWTLLRPGADAVGERHGSHYYRLPRPDQIAYRGLLLELECQIEDACWEFIRPYPYGPHEPRPAHTDQSLFLIRARHAWIDAMIADPGIPNGSIYDLIVARNNNRLCAGWPLQTNDYIAYRPGVPMDTVILIPHPPNASWQYWTQTPSGKTGRPGRLLLYKPVVAHFYTVAVFSEQQTMRELEGTIRAAGMIPRLADQIGEFLSRVADGSLQTPPPPPAAFEGAFVARCRTDDAHP